MRGLCFPAVVVAVALAPFARAQARGGDGPGSFLDSVLTASSTEACSPAPCVVPPVRPSGSTFTTDAPIASNPRDPRQLLLGSDDGSCLRVGLGFYFSRDAGTTWQHECMSKLFLHGNEYDPAEDPMAVFDDSGNAYEAGYYLIDNDFSSSALVALQKSTDGGASWSAPVPVMGHADAVADYTWMTADTSPSSPYFDSVYISGVLIGPINDPFGSNFYNEVAVSHSSDGGRTWVQVPVGPPQNTPEQDQLTSIATGRDGTVYVIWMRCTIQAQACTFGQGDLLLSRSIDGGNTWSAPTFVARITQTWPLPNTADVRVYDRPVLGVDSSDGPFAGSLYVTAYNWNGMQMRVGVIRSVDGGSTWSKPVPVAPLGDNHDQFFPWLSVSPTGLVGVSWMDRRNDPTNTDYQPFAAISKDGGMSFQPNVLLSDGFSDPNRGGEGNGWIGDYTENTWAGSTFIAAWMDNSQTDVMVDAIGGIVLK